MNSKITRFINASMIPTTIKFIVFYLLIKDTIIAQRPSYAGPRPQSGYKDSYRLAREAPPQAELSNRFDDDLNRVQAPLSPSVNVVQPISTFIPINDKILNQIPELGNRFSSNATTNETLSSDALSDREFVNRLNNLPKDQRPIWYLNAQMIEAQRNRSVGQFNTSGS